MVKENLIKSNIMQCRRNGLSDYQWCQNQWINLGTFYNWVSKLRKTGYSIPDSANKVSAIPVKQEVVKNDMTESPSSTPVMLEQDVSHPAIPAHPCTADEIECENISVRLFNGANNTVIQNTLKCIGGKHVCPIKVQLIN